MRKSLSVFVIILVLFVSVFAFSAAPAKAAPDGEPAACDEAWDMINNPGAWANFLNDAYSDYDFTFTSDLIMQLGYRGLMVFGCSI